MTSITINTHNEECPICFTEFSDSNDGLLVMSCKHSICINCFTELIKSKSFNIKRVKCPLCRKSMMKKSLMEELRELSSDMLIIKYRQLNLEELDEELRIKVTKYVLARREGHIIGRLRYDLKQMTTEQFNTLLTNPDSIIDEWDINETCKQQKRAMITAEENRRKVANGYIHSRDNLRIPLLADKKVRKNSCSYAILQVLIDAPNKKLPYRDLLDIMAMYGKSYTYQTYRSNIFKLQDSGYTTNITTLGVISHIQLTPDYIRQT